MRVDSTAVTFGGVSELHYELSDTEKLQKAEAAAAPLQAAQQVRLFNQEVRSELQALRQSSPALADLDQVRKLIGDTSLRAEPIEPMERRGGLRDSMAESMSRAREELLLAESLVSSRRPPQSPAAQPTTAFQRPNTWSNGPGVELSPEEQEEIRHKIYGSLVGAADHSAPKHQHPMDTEDSALRERAEASRLRAALMRFDQDDAQSNSSFLSDADAQAEQHRSAMASQLEQMAYETERSRLQDAEQLAAGEQELQRLKADEQELQRLKAEIAWNKRNVGDAAGSEQTVQRSHQMHRELAQAKNDLSSVHRDEATLETMRAKEVDLLQQTLKASQRRCSALDEEVRELREQLERRTQDGGRGGGDTQELEAELAKEKALRERYAALCVKLEKACESPGRRAHDQSSVDTEALKESVVQSEQMLREAESHARQRLAEAEREISMAKESAQRSEGQAKENAGQLRNAQRALAAAERRSAALQEEKQATEEAMAVSVGAQEERISLLTQQLEEAEARASDVQPSGRLAQLEESLRSATAQKADVERKLARSEQATRELSRRAEQAAEQTQEAVAAQQAAEQALSQAQSVNASPQEQDAATRRAAAAEADKRRLQQELGAAHRQQAAQKSEVEKLKAQLAESKKSGSAQNGARRAHDTGQPSPKQKQKEERLLQAQQEMEGKLRKAWNDMKAMQKRNTELLSEVQEATAAAQAARAEAEAARAHGGASMRLPSPVRPYGGPGPSLHPGHASSLALLSHSGSSNRSSKVPQSTWVPTAAAVAAAVSPNGSMSLGVDANLVGWESRDSAKESIESWLGHALDVVGASVHVTTRDERKEWSTLATKLNTWLSGVTARAFTKVATDEELAKLAAATHSTLQAAPGTISHWPVLCRCLMKCCTAALPHVACRAFDPVVKRGSSFDSCTVWQIAVQVRI